MTVFEIALILACITLLALACFSVQGQMETDQQVPKDS